MSKILSIFFFTQLGITACFSQESAFFHQLNEPCDSSYIFDYRMVYNDTLTPISAFIDGPISERFHLYVFYFFGDFDMPDELIVSLNHIDFPEIILFGKLCNVEKIFQEGDLSKAMFFYSKEERKKMNGN